MKSTKKRGGTRPGAGRKTVNPEGKSLPISFAIPESMLADVDRLAEKMEIPRGRVITEALRRFIASQKRAGARSARRNT